MVNIVAIVGCSQGYGEALLKASLENPAIMSTEPGAIFILLTRNKDKTICLWNRLYFETRGKVFVDDTESNVQVYVEEVDLIQLPECHRLGEILTVMFRHIHADIDTFYMLLNAGSVSPVAPMLDPISPDFETDISNHSTLNFVSYVLLIRIFVRLVLGHKPTNSTIKVRVVNISSLAATHGLYGMGVYGAIKAARESILRTLAAEVESDMNHRDIRLLNYAPGPMDTDMVRIGLLSDGVPCNALKQLGSFSFVDPNLSAQKCLSLITSPEKLNLWENGDHIDYYDQI
jgi:NAD(P)-dependent dehydrogenase (short-subunit alcohol dehydrogenase family)